MIVQPGINLFHLVDPGLSCIPGNTSAFIAQSVMALRRCGGNENKVSERGGGRRPEVIPTISDSSIPLSAHMQHKSAIMQIWGRSESPEGACSNVT